MTEKEAEIRWCPMTRYVYSPDHADIVSNKIGDVENAYCIASDCMAWRWDHRNSTMVDGYCGLGGKP